MDSIDCVKFLCDFLFMTVLGCIFLYMKYFLKPFLNGFYCDDLSINMPFKKSTVTNLMLVIISTGLPLLIFILTELVRTFNMKSKQQRVQLSNKYKLKLFSHRTFEISEQVGNIVINYTHYLIGLLINSNLTLIGKKTVGRLRPNFLDVCKPNTNPYSICRMNSANTYLRVDVDFKCTALKQHEVIESRLSFPSGHASTIFYMAIFLILFIHRKWNRRSISALAQFFQFSLFGLGIFVGLSRIVDNKHHPTDVLAGTILGTLVAFSHFYYLNLFYKRYNYKNKYNVVNTGDDHNKDLANVESQVKETSFRKQNTLKVV